MKATKRIRITKAHLICYVISVSPIVPTREEIMRKVHVLENKTAPFAITSNNCYFSPTGLGAGGKSSVIYKGLVEKVGTFQRCFTYRNTPTGAALAAEYVAQMQ